MNALKPLSWHHKVPRFNHRPRFDNRPRFRRLPERKAVTIGIGFLCEDGVLIAADNLISVPGYHKYYECKLYPHSREGLAVTFTFSGNPIVMKMFNGKFEKVLGQLRGSIHAEDVQTLVENVLSDMDILDGEGAIQLHMLCGVSVADPPEMRLIRTEGKAVAQISGFDYIGVEDTSLLRYLVPLVTGTHTYTADQAFGLAVLLILQAKRYVTDCGGDTDVYVMKPNGHLEVRGASSPYNTEQYLLRLETFSKKVATALFDRRVQDAEFDDALNRFLEEVRQLREPHGMW
jgi:hypothetical protein